MPYFEHLPDIYLPGGKSRVEKIGATLTGITGLGITSHLIGSVISGRIGKHQIKGTQLAEPSPGEKVPADEIIIKKLNKNSEFSQELVVAKLNEIIDKQKNLDHILKKLPLKRNSSLLGRLKFWVKKRNEK